MVDDAGYKRKLGIATAIVVAVLVVVGIGVYSVAENALRARLLKAFADDIATDNELMGYALPRGNAAYAKHCVTCHGDRTQGDPTQGNPRLNDDDWLYGNGRIAEIERTLLYGIRSGNTKGRDPASMPAYATAHPYKQYEIPPLLPREINDAVAFLQSFQHPPADVAAVQRGREIYYGADKGQCWDCHGGDAKGDTAIGAPNLTDDIWLYGGSQESIYDSIAYGASGACPAWISRLPLDTIRAIAVYLYFVRTNTNATFTSTGKTHE